MPPTHRPAALPLVLGCLVSLGLAACRSTESQMQGTSQEPVNPVPANVDTVSPGPPPPGGQAIPGTLTPAQLQAAMRTFADQYRDLIAQACDAIARRTDDPAIRRRAHRIKLDAATAMYDIAMDPVPATALINGLVMVSLQVNATRQHGAALFPDGHERLLERTVYLQETLFRLAARVMNNQQRIQLLDMCNQWSQAHPNQNDIWYVRLSDLPGIEQGTSVANVVGGLTDMPAQFLGKFIPFNSAGEAVSEAQLLAERMSWLAPRLMILGQWRVEAVVYDALAAIEVTDALDVAQRLTTVAETLPDTLTEQREGLFNDLSSNEDSLHNLLTDTRATLETARGLTADATTLLGTGDTALSSADELVRSVDGLASRLQQMQDAAIAADADRPAPQEPGRPFDINEYTRAIESLNAVVNDTTTLVRSLDTTTSDAALDARLEVVTGRIAGLIWLTGIVAAGAALLIVLAVKLIPSRRR